MKKILEILDNSGYNENTWCSYYLPEELELENGKTYITEYDGKHKELTYCEGFSQLVDCVVILDLPIFVHLIKEWSSERGLNKYENRHAQMCKIAEEVGELSGSLLKSNDAGIKDGIGDIFVTLIVLCGQLGIDFNECVELAWGEISDRKGKMVNGSFVKDGN